MGAITTAEAAAQARVTIKTIRAWVREGAVVATKQSAGRWFIDSGSLFRHIMGAHTCTTYHLEHETRIHDGREYTRYRIVRTDGTPGGCGPGEDPRTDPAEKGFHRAVFHREEAAVFFLRFYEKTDPCYRIMLRRPSAKSIDRSPYWEITGGEDDDPRYLKEHLSVSETDTYSLPTSDNLIARAHQHAAGATVRVVEHARRKAETAERKARARQLAAIARVKGPLATQQQVDYALSLLARREHSGEVGDFLTGPTTRANLEEMPRHEAFTYIASLIEQR